MLKSSSCNYSDAYILVKAKIIITGAKDNSNIRKADERNRVVIFKDCAPFINCKSEINKKEIDNAKGIDIVIPKFHLIEYSDKYSKTSGRSWQYYRDEPNHSLKNCESFTSKAKIRRYTPADGNDVEIIVPLQHF